MGASSKPLHRSQDERTAQTRARVLDAVLDCLVERGYAGTTTTAVAARAGVSRGAQLHHYRTRAALVAAAVEHLYARLAADYEKAFANLSPGADRVDAAIELLWETFQDPRLAAVLELFVAGRTDGELREQLAKVAARHRARVIGLARAYFPVAPSKEEEFQGLLTLVLDALQGMAVAQLVEPDEAGAHFTLARLKRVAKAELQRGETLRRARA
ncbi:MAG TPA: TetR/AcrR family transcriptional regulator [Deltaproteobacteria bacterium]|jgi:AcrR family transcriptional regulator|nr:TetR/AcrR family transcriptional regulator [Deltaproteobacteria bacterium]